MHTYLLMEAVGRHPVPLLSIMFPPAQGTSKGEQAGHQDELGNFFESTETWLALYEEVQALAARKQAELRRQLVSSAEARGTHPTRQQVVQ